MGELHKTEVRRIADEIGLPNAKKKDSTGICFIGERPFREFLNRYISHEPGPIKDAHGRVIGEHVGLSFYTLGQRQGLGIGGIKARGAQKGGGDHAPWFVARKELEHNTLWVVQGHDHPVAAVAHAARRRRQLDRGHATRARRLRGQDTLPPGRRRLPAGRRRRRRFLADVPAAQWAVTPGQSAVVYDGEVCLGGGVIAVAALNARITTF